MGRLNKKAYEELIQEDIKAIERNFSQDDKLEKWHIITVLKWSIEKQYPNKELKSRKYGKRK